jgi:hypothetical protein
MTNSVLVQQNDAVIKYTVTDQDGVAVNLTSATIKWSIRRNLQTAAALTKTTSSGISITNAAGGIFEVTLTNTDTTGLTGTYTMEAIITDAAAKVYTITNTDMTPDTLQFRSIYTEA